MIKKIIYITTILFAAIIDSLQLSAQEGLVRYKYVLNVDSTLYSRNTEGIPAFLYFNPVKSLFVFDRWKDTAYLSGTVNSVPLEDGAIVNYEERDEYGNMFYKDFASRSISMRRLLFKEAFIARENLPAINWIILKDTQTIGGYLCKKAVTHFRGRYYEAWFAPDIPVSDGPWKLCGLPGLILEAYDKNKEIQYLFVSIQLPYPSLKYITAPRQGKYLSFEAFKNIERTQADKMIKMVKASMDRNDDVDISVKIFPIEKNYE